MEDEHAARRPRAAPIIGMVVGVVFLALGVAAFLFGGGPIVGAIGGYMLISGVIGIVSGGG
jgi:hypothetical protein